MAQLVFIPLQTQLFLVCISFWHKGNKCSRINRERTSTFLDDRGKVHVEGEKESCINVVNVGEIFTIFYDALYLKRYSVSTFNAYFYACESRFSSFYASFY